MELKTSTSQHIVPQCDCNNVPRCIVLHYDRAVTHYVCICMPLHSPLPVAVNNGQLMPQKTPFNPNNNPCAARVVKWQA
jgi:hypothetical protein